MWTASPQTQILPKGESQSYSFEDNEAVIKMIIEGSSPTMRHVSRTHRVALDWLFDRIKLDPKIQIKYVDTKNQPADLRARGRNTSHLKNQGINKDKSNEVPRMSMDFFFVSQEDEKASANPIMVMVDEKTGEK